MKKLFLNNYLINKIAGIFFPFYKSEEISKIFDILEKNQPKDKTVAMFVGGCVRKHILNEEIDDIDIATIFSPEEVKKKFKDTEVKIIDTGVEHGSVTLLLNKFKFEITTLRKDVKTDGRHAEVSFTENWKIDSERRDFTMNAIYLDRKGNIFDPQMGVKDLKNGTVKFIGDPSKRIEEDYLRIIRFIRFSLQYNYNLLESSTIKAIKLNLNGIKSLSKERIFNELLKIIKLSSFKNILQHEDLQIIFSLIFPEFKNLKDVKKLNLLSKNEISRIDSSIILTLLLMDGSNNHEYFCHKYKVSNFIKNKLDVFFMSFEKYKSDKNYFKKNLKKNIYFLGKEIIKDFTLFIFLKNRKFTYKELIALNNNIDKISIPKFPYNGQYLINKGFVPGKKIGEVLKELEKNWIENDYSLSEKNAITIIDKIKKSNILHV